MKLHRRFFQVCCLSLALIAFVLPSDTSAVNASLLQKQKKGKKSGKGKAAKEKPAKEQPAKEQPANEPPAQAQPAAVQPAKEAPAPAVGVAATPSAATDVKASAAPTKETKRVSNSMWSLDVVPYAVLGSGHPGKMPLDFDKPDGVAFTKQGWLLATDAKNRRIQIWDVKTRTHLGEFGHGVFGGEVVDIAVMPDDRVLITDQVLNLAYLFEQPKPGATNEKGKPLGPYDLQFNGTRFGEQGFDKLGGIAVDAQGRVYLVDAHLNEVRRFLSDFKPDPDWKFERARPDGDTYLHGCEGIAFDEANGNLFIASEKDSIVQVFDLQTGAYKRRLLGKTLGADGIPSGSPVFSGAIEGLTIAHNHLFAVDESAGQIQVFDLSKPGVFNSDLAAFSIHAKRSSAYRGFFGHPPMVNFEDKLNVALQAQVKAGSIIPGQANPPGYFCSPDAIASHTDAASGETYIAIADQCNYRIAVYRWSDINRALNGAGAGTTPVVAQGAGSGKASAPSGGKGRGKKKKGKA